ncbi:MAG TPA: bifunctional molybdenum cofactor biosynthesis protein MoaC/MoaB, partial [Chitinophagales bacterium]|nr:bifunctional molybdenum cofactor biosynthesis protein MoaC/MoaB [Chitinophagales bacterium]
SYRMAVAQAVVSVSREETIIAIREGKVPKGNVFEMSRAAGLLAIKNTSNVIPDCHPLPVEGASISHDIQGLDILISVQVETVYKTGVEVEAMHGASIVALTIYDMLKPIDKQVSISNIRLLEKKGGKSDFKDQLARNIRTAVVVCSDSISSGKKEDKAGKAIIEKLEPLQVEVEHYTIISDDKDVIQQKVRELIAGGTELLLITGGTGLSKRDITPEAVGPLLERDIPGMMEAARAYGQQRMPYAMFSRGVAGMIGDSVVITLPGSTRGAIETMDALFPYVLHLFRVSAGMRHDG